MPRPRSLAPGLACLRAALSKQANFTGIRISLDAVTLGTIAAPEIVLHSGHEEVSTRGTLADGVRRPRFCVALAPPFLPKAESPAGCSCAEPSSKATHATQATRGAEDPSFLGSTDGARSVSSKLPKSASCKDPS